MPATRAVPARRALAATIAALLMVLSVLAQTASPSTALADTAPPDSSLPATASTDALPTAQIDGVAWTQLVVGNTVYVGGSFTTARPAGAAPNTQTVPRTNLMAYNVQTGALISSFAPVLNGQVRGLAASTDGKTLYVVGAFTTVNGATRNRIAAFDVATGALSNTFKPSVNYTILGVATTENTVYFGGSFTTVNGVARLAAAAVDSVTGALRPWAPQKSTSGDVRQLVVSPDRSKVILGGNFVTMNGSSTPGYGLAAVDTNTGANLPLPVNSLIRDANSKSAIMSLVAMPDGFYGSGYAYSKSDGNLEGSFKADWDGNLIWVEDCHGDTYSVFPFNGALYAAGHPHFCGNIGGFPQTDPVWTYQRGIAFTQAATGLVTKDQYGYFNYEGKPRPTLLNWFPDINIGSFTGQSQGPWSVSGNNDYVVYGGEFTQVNGQDQQGLVRFGKASVAPNTDGPRLSGSQFLPAVQNLASGVRLSWPANYDRDNELLSYALIRNGNNADPIYTTDKRSTFWFRPNLAFLDTTVTPGTTYSYRIHITDPKGNVRLGDSVSVTASGGTTVSDYDRAVLADGPSAYWPLGEASGTVVTDYAGSDNASKGTTVSQGVTGAIPGDPGTAYRFPGAVTTSTVGSSTLRTGPMIFSTEAWFRTTSTKGGKIIGFGKSVSGDSPNSDRHVYLSNTGKVYFGVNPGAVKTVNSTASYNNGQWHHVVATLGVGGMSLYVDGQLVGSRTDISTAQVYNGYWRVGGDFLFGWPENPSTGYLAGDVDQAAVYPEVLTPAQVRAHYGLASATPNVAPTAAFTPTATGLAVALDGSGSSDPDGAVASYAWDFGDGSTGTGATPSHTYAAEGTYAIKLTITDDRGATGTTTKSVDLVRGNDAPTASFTAATNELRATFDASASTDADGTVAGYAWDFGDGTTDTGVAPTHTYPAGGTFAVKLTVTDDDGATGTQTKSVTVAPAPPVNAPFVSDDFNRTLASGLGNADLGGAWTVTGGAASYAVNNGAGIVKLATAGVTRNAYLGSTLRDSSDTTLTLTYDKVATGSGVYYNVSGRRVSATEDYRADFRITNANRVVLSLSALQGSSNATTLGGSAITLPGTVAMGDQVKVRLQTFGTSPTTIRAKVWWGTASEPSTWTVSATNSYAGLQRTGAIGLTTYLSTSTTNAPLNVRLLSIASKPVTP